MKILAAAAILSVSLTGVSLAQSSSDGSANSGTSDSGSQQGDTSGATGNASIPADTSAGDEPQCPPGQKSADSAATNADKKCVAE
ncbi:hypothetical protein DMY87_17970 [Rhizobium wuzhouense]|uniref:Oxidoreductase n=2 Tax=Rhizobium wuzhouense TaxID=1986026 RepID=A0ABX5NNU6_9HYPH|nr:hypothetical protein DMY87_17970 [Rhizobium wuzhouense]